jgi:anti-sigma regulatory factor (Ser/Thr protein kinase)
MQVKHPGLGVRTPDIDLRLDDAAQLPDARSAVMAWASAHPAAGVPAAQVTSAAQELLTNGFTHGEAPVRLVCWHANDTLVLQVSDHGDARVPADADPAAGGRGMRQVRKIADVVTTDTHGGETSVRAYIRPLYEG